jgi:signal transduction histidine kinase/CheY-like chemotaxis protein
MNLKNLKKILSYSRDFPLEHRVFYLFLLVGVLLGIWAALANYALGLHPLTIWGPVFFSFLLAFLFHFALLKPRWLQPIAIITFLLTTLVLTPLMYYTNSGVSGGFLFYPIVFAVMYAVVFNGRLRWGMILLVLIVNALLLFLEYRYPEWVVPFESRGKRFFDVALSITEVTIGIIILLLLAKNSYNRERLKAEQIAAELENKNKELSIAKENAEQAARAKEHFLSTMSHEIRTPMNAVIGVTNLMKDDREQALIKENLEILSFSAESLMSVINDVLDYNKLESGRIQFENTSFHLYFLANRVCGLFRQKAREKGLLINLDYDSHIPRYVLGDMMRLSQILNNLLSNAVKFTDEGQIVLRIKSKNVKPEKAVVRFEVEDTGIGIAEDKLGLIFEEFSQAEASTARRYGGAGLGLAISRKLLELMGSHIEVFSTLDKGSLFRFDLELAVSYTKGRKDEERGSLRESTSPHKLKGKKVLIVEDNPINTKIAEKFLIKWGLHIDYAENGEIALDKAMSNRYHLILMDIHMPVMDGYQATRQIRKSKGTNQNTPIIALTASVMHEVRKKVLAAGMDDYIAKPFQPKELFIKLVKQLDQ